MSEAMRLKALVVHPGASWSTADVFAGLTHGLRAHGAEVVPYQLDNQIAKSEAYFQVAYRRSKRLAERHARLHPELPALEVTKPSKADIFYRAGLGALEAALREQVDVVLVVSAMYLHPDVMILLKRANKRVVVLFTESPYDIQKELKIAGGGYIDGGWTNEASSLPAFRQVNPRMGYLPHAWHPARHRPGPHEGDDLFPAHDVVFVGSAFRERIEFLSAIDWTGIDLGLYGTWDELPSRHKLRAFVKGEQVDNRAAAALYRRARVGLNLYRTSIGWGHDAPQISYAESLNPRAYELAACGAFSLSTFRAEVPKVFGDLVPTFREPSEAAALIRLWLADDAGRRRVAASLPACVAESSWVQRAATVIGDLRALLLREAA